MGMFDAARVEWNTSIMCGTLRRDVLNALVAIQDRIDNGDVRGVARRKYVIRKAETKGALTPNEATTLLTVSAWSQRDYRDLLNQLKEDEQDG